MCFSLAVSYMTSFPLAGLQLIPNLKLLIKEFNKKKNNTVEKTNKTKQSAYLFLCHCGLICLFTFRINCFILKTACSLRSKLALFLKWSLAEKIVF